MVAPMVRMLKVAALAALVLASAQGCARKAQESGSAEAAHTLLAAAWSGDAKGFEAAVDRPAVRADLRRQLLAVAQANTLSVEGGASDAALDRMITPQAFRLVQAGTYAPLAAAPSRAQTAALLRAAGPDRACVPAAASGPACLLTFARQKAGWRLVGMAPAGFSVQVAPEPAKPARS
jgi:hypothetical protein